MGLDYEYQLYFPSAEVWNVLESVAAMAGPVTAWKEVESDAAPVGETKLILPGRELVLPFTVRFKNEVIVFDESLKQLNFDTSLWFTTDKYIERYLTSGFKPEEIKNFRDDKSRVDIGYIYLTVIPNLRNSSPMSRWKPDICSFEFAAATTSMSLLFEDSVSIKRTLQNLIQKHNGFGGFLNDPDGAYHAPHAIWPPETSLSELIDLLTEPTSEI